MTNTEDPLPPDVQAAIEDGRIIEAIKLLRRHQGLDLKEAKDLVESRMPVKESSVRDGRIAPDRGVGKFMLVAVVLAVAYAAWHFLAA